MPYNELLILLPCHSLEDFPTYHEGEDAQSLLSSWSALWHPELLAAAGKAPTWRRIEDPPSDVKDKLIVVPTVCISRLPTGFSQRVKDEGGTLIRKTASREEILSVALAGLQPRLPTPDARLPTPGVDPDLAADFLALGYCYLQIELLTRQMRYSSNLDETYFKGTALAAATAAVEGNAELAREKLAACFNVLAEERDHYYPVDAFVLDLNLTAKTTLGEALRQELSRETPTNVLLSGELLAEIAAREPTTLAALKDGLAAGRIGLVGGEASEERLPLLSPETILAELRRGLATYEQHLGRRPEVYGRWRYGLTPNLPGILHKLGFRGALHAGFEEGKTPDGLQFKVRWEGLDGSAIDAIARTPLDASQPQTFLAFATKMGESMDSDHVATLCLAHWPGQASEWIGDLRRIARYCRALGKWVTVDEYFASTDQPGQLDRFEADRYRSPYFKQAVIRRQDDPVSTQIRYWRRQATLAAAEALQTLAGLVTGRVQGPGFRVPGEVRGQRSEVRGQETGERGRGTAQDSSVLGTQYSVPSTPQTAGHAASAAESPPTTHHSPLTESAPAEIDAAVSSHFAAATQQLADALTIAEPNNPQGTLVINPSSFVRRIGVEDIGLSSPPTVERPVYAVDRQGEALHAVVDVPALGFVHLAPGPAASREKKTILLAEEGVLRNEFFEAIINPTTGSLAAIHEYKSRGNRLSQQLALRLPAPKQKPGDTHRDPDEAAWYSVMAADSVETTIATTTLGEIVVRGRLLDQNGNRLAGFRETYRLWRGSRVLHIEIELDPDQEPKADPWNSYYCCRWAWADEGAEIFRTVNQTRQAAVEKRFEAPHYVEIAAEPQSTTILTGGLAFHRRQQERMLDTVLIARGERERKFRLGVGIDLAHPLHEALGILTPPAVVPHVPQPASGSSGWLLHLSSRNVIATALTPLVESGRLAGFHARLLETAGRPANLAITPFRAVKSASTVDFQGNALHECRLEDDKIKLDLAAHEWVELVARW